MNFKKLYESLPGPSRTRFTAEAYNQMQNLKHSELWYIYSTRYPNATITDLTDDGDIYESLDGVDIALFIGSVRDCNLDLNKNYLVENPDISDSLIWTVDSIADLADLHDLLEWCIDEDHLEWLSVTPVMAELDKGTTAERLRTKIDELLIEMQAEHGIMDGGVFPDMEFELDERLESLAELVDAIIDIQRVFAEDKRR